MAEKSTIPEFLSSPRSEELSLFEKDVFENPEKLFEADLLKLSPEDPAFASKVLISAYISHYNAKTEELAQKLNLGKNDPCAELNTIIQECTAGVAKFLSQNKALLSSQSSNDSSKGGNRYDNERVWKNYW